MIQNNPKLQSKPSLLQAQSYSYQDITSYLDSHWVAPIISLTPFKKIILDINTNLLSTPSVLIAGTGGKTITSHFLTTLLKKEKIKTGSFCSPHFTAYNEQISIDGKLISNKDFTTYATTLLNKSTEQKHTLHSHELLMGIMLLHGFEHKVRLLILEQKNLDQLDPVQLLTPRIIGVTRLAPDQIDVFQAFNSILKTATSTTFVVSADQSKTNLQELCIAVKLKKAEWMMPIRKIAPLSYPYEQLHGRCATLAERIASTYVAHFAKPKDNESSLLHKPKKQRGRPTLETKEQEKLQPQKTVDEFWQSIKNSIPGRFQLLKTKKSSILLDCANSIDAFQNLFLGIRLLAYKAEINNIVIVAGSHSTAFDHETFIKDIRYFFKKNSGEIFFCPIKFKEKTTKVSWNTEHLCNIAKNLKIKSTAFDSFQTAFSTAIDQSDDKSLVVVTGSAEIITEYLKLKQS
jgi:folylpolyglutamate synthase/dihydropteroate synthase